MDVQNFMHLQILISEFNSALRQRFKEEFKQKYEQDWIEGDQSNYSLFSEIINQLNTSQKVGLKKMNTEIWDISMFIKIFKTLQTEENTQIKPILEAVRKVRNQLAHLSNLSINKKDYENFHFILLDSLKKLNWDSDRIAAIANINCMLLETKRISNTSDESSTNSFNALKEKGNSLFAKKDFKGAADAFTKALALKNISKKQKSILFSNRSSAYLELYMKENNDLFIFEASQDAKRSLENDPSYSKAYYRLAIVYHIKNKLEKAINFYKKCLIFYPGNEEIKSFLASANESHEKLKRNEHLTPLNLPQDYEEMIEAEVKNAKKEE